MTIKFHGFNQDGWFQSGKGEVITLWTVHDIEATGVIATRAELVQDGILKNETLSAANSITINDVTYEADATYDDAYYQQTNVDTFVDAFNALANPVYVKVHAGIDTATDPNVDFTTEFLGGTTTFGTDLVAANNSGTAPVYRIDLFFEQKGMFTTGDKGDVTVGAGDNFGDSVAAVEAILDGLNAKATSNTNTAVDVDITGGAVAVGDDVPMGIAAATRSYIGDIEVAPDLQS